MSVRSIVALVRGVAETALDADASITEAGVDSLAATELRNKLQRAAVARSPPRSSSPRRRAHRPTRCSGRCCGGRRRHTAAGGSDARTRRRRRADDDDTAWGDGSDAECVVYNRGRGRADHPAGARRGRHRLCQSLPPDERRARGRFSRTAAGCARAPTAIPMLTLHGRHLTRSAILREVAARADLLARDRACAADRVMACVDLKDAHRRRLQRARPTERRRPRRRRALRAHPTRRAPAQHVRLLAEHPDAYVCGAAFTVADVVLYDALRNFVDALFPHALLRFPTSCGTWRAWARPRIRAATARGERETVPFAPKMRGAQSHGRARGRRRRRHAATRPIACCAWRARQQRRRAASAAARARGVHARGRATASRRAAVDGGAARLFRPSCLRRRPVRLVRGGDARRRVAERDGPGRSTRPLHVRRRGLARVKSACARSPFDAALGVGQGATVAMLYAAAGRPVPHDAAAERRAAARARRRAARAARRRRHPRVRRRTRCRTRAPAPPIACRAADRRRASRRARTARARAGATRAPLGGRAPLRRRADRRPTEE